MFSDAEATKMFTPSEKEQLILILKEKCPHNQGWTYSGHGRNDEAYVCKTCGKVELVWY